MVVQPKQYGEVYEPRSECPINTTIEVFERGRAGWAPSGRLDTARAAAQFRLPSVERRDADRGHAHLVGHANTRTTEKVYRKELRPVLRRGAKAMEDIFKAHHEASEPPILPPHPHR